MNPTKFFIFVFPLTSIQLSFAKPYVWPTDASRVLSGTFAEYRPGHLHAGIDIKTWGMEGYHIFAIDSGSVVRLTVSPYDGGKGIMLRLNNGWRTVNYHLSRFTDDMEKRVRAEQIRQGKYRVQLDFPPGQFPVTPGEIIGYSGKTGVGYPHVHFEVVDTSEIVFNPLRLFKLDDQRPPNLVQIAVRPMHAESHVNFDWQPVILTPIRTGPGMYALEDTIDCLGEIGFAYHAYDQPEGTTNQDAIYEARLFINDSLLFASRYDAFYYDDWQFIDLDWDAQMMRRDLGRFRKLYVDKENPLPFYRTSPQKGVVTVIPEESLVPFRIEIADFNGNTSVLTGVLRGCSQASQSSGAVPIETGNMASIPTFHTDFYDDYVRFEVEGVPAGSDSAELIIDMNHWYQKRIPLQQKSFKKWIGILPLQVQFAGRWDVLLNVPHHFRDLSLASLTVHYSGKRITDALTSEDETFQIELNINTLLRPFWGCVETNFQNVAGFENQKIYSVRSADFPFNSRAMIRIHPNPGLIPIQKLGVYAFNHNRLNWLNRRIDNGWLTASVRSLGNYVVLPDTVQPAIHRIQPADQEILDGPLREVKCWFSDSLSGIAGEENYRLLLDGKPLIVAYDYEEESGTAWLDDPPVAGYHRLEAIIRDRAGNVRRQQTAFFIRKKEDE